MAKRRREVLAWSTQTTLQRTAEKLQLLRRLEESNRYGWCRCVSCGTKKHWKEMQGGHFCSRTSNSVILEEDNVHPQCPNCNQWDTSSNSSQRYYEYMVQRHGQDRVNELQRQSNQRKSWTKDELLEIRDGLMSRIKDQKLRLAQERSQEEWKDALKR